MKNIGSRKTIIFSVVTIYRSACQHPFVLGMVSFLLIMYWFLPHLFGLLVSSSPIIMLTTLFLGVLLTFGEPNIPEIEEQETAHASSPSQSCASRNDHIIEEDESLSAHSIYNRKIAERCRKLEIMSLSSTSNKEKESGANVSAFLPADMDKKQMFIKNTGINKKAVGNLQHLEKAETHAAKPLLYAEEEADHTFPTSSIPKETEVLENQGPSVADQFVSSVVSSWKVIDNHDATKSDSDCAESSSPGASMADIILQLDELCPLLATKDLHPVNASIEDLHSLYDASTEDDGIGEEAENQGEGGEEEEETKEEHEDGAALAIKWTEDDAKNLLVLGTSELERNERLEMLIAKRRARKNLSVEMNLIELDTHDTLPQAEELSYIQMQIPHISTAKRNPFDLPYDLDPVPGSAPSVLLPRKNPFDLPHDVAEESGGPARVSHLGSVLVQQRDMLLRRHESFALGESFIEFKREKHDVELRPYFVAARMDVEVSGYAHLAGHISAKSDSKVSSTHESESVSSAADQDHVDEPLNHLLHQQSEIGVTSSVNDCEDAERESNYDDELDLNETLCSQSEENIHSQYSTIPNTLVLGDSVLDITDDKQNRRYLSSPISEAEVSDMAVETCSMSGSSYSLEISTKSLNLKSTGSTDHKVLKGHTPKHSRCTMQSGNLEAAIPCDHKVVEPVYDCSLSAAEKYMCNMPSIEEEFLHGGKSCLKTTSRSPETLVEHSGIGSASVASLKNIFSVSMSDDRSKGKLPPYGNGEPWVAPLNLSSVEEVESRSREIEVIREQDVIQVEFTYDCSIVSSLPESPSEQTIRYSSSSESDSGEGTTIEMGVDLHFRELEKVVGKPHVDVLGIPSFS